MNHSVVCLATRTHNCIIRRASAIVAATVAFVPFVYESRIRAHNRAPFKAARRLVFRLFRPSLTRVDARRNDKRASDEPALSHSLSLVTANPRLISAWGRVEIIRVNTTRQASSVLSNLTERRTSNMNGYPLRVGTFDLNPSIVAELNQSVDDSDLYKGLDEAMLRTIARRMNFATRRVSPADNKGFGYQFLNGTYVGALGITPRRGADNSLLGER